MSVEFDVTIGETWLGLDAYATHLTIEVGPKDPEGAETRPLPMSTLVEGWAITLPAVEARNLRRFLEYVYPASEDEPADIDAQRPATTRPGDQPAALPPATAESDRSLPSDERCGPCGHPAGWHLHGPESWGDCDGADCDCEMYTPRSEWDAVDFGTGWL